MQTRFFRSNNFAEHLQLLFWISLVVFITVKAVASDGFQYFESDIDYWNDKRSAVNAPDKVQMTLPNDPKAKDQFEWKKFLNPKNKDFFKEGDYSPPEPFLEVVRNPSDENLKMWFSYIDKKNELFSRLQKRMSEFSTRHATGTREPKIAAFDQAPGKEGAGDIDPKRFRFRFYFDSTCPHCKRMVETIVNLQNKGFFIESRQIDPRPLLQMPFPVTRIDQNELKAKDIQSVPLLLVGDLKKKLIYRISGFQTTDSVLSELNKF